MRHHAETLRVPTAGRGTVELTGDVQRVVAAAGVDVGVCNIFVHHTSASVIVCENADPAVRADLERFAAQFVRDGDAMFTHTCEGPDDMPAHVRSVFTQASVSVPVAGGRCALGTWQGVYLWEHRRAGHARRVTVTVIGCGDPRGG